MLLAHLNRLLHERQAKTLYRARSIAELACTPQQEIVSETAGAQPKAQIAFCSNDYLGLASHPLLITALSEGAVRWGVGSGGSHLVSGHQRPHAQIESELAAFLSPCIPDARALVFSSGYMANQALLTTLGDAQATIFSDKLNHASLIDGIRLARAKYWRYPHCRLDVLEVQLSACTTPIKLIVTDAVFSMDGDLAPLPALLQLAHRYDAWIIVDDAHGFGVLGDNGRGSLAHFGVSDQRFIYMGTLGKAAGGAGAFVVAHPVVIESLINMGRSYIYTTALPPAIVAAMLTSVRLIAAEEGEKRRALLHELIKMLRSRLMQLINAYPEAGWRLEESETAIQPLIVGDNTVALALSHKLSQAGFWVPAIRPPTVPVGTARLRITLSAAHRPDQVEALCATLATFLEQDYGKPEVH